LRQKGVASGKAVARDAAVEAPNTGGVDAVGPAGGGAVDVQVGLLDIDICGPSAPKLTGLEGEEVHQSGSGWSPVYVKDNLAVMSIGEGHGTPCSTTQLLGIYGWLLVGAVSLVKHGGQGLWPFGACHC